MDRVAVLPTPGEVRRAFRRELPPWRRAALRAWLASCTTFGTVTGTALAAAVRA